MENENLPVSKTAMTYGVYLGLASVLFTVVIYMAGLMGNRMVSLLSFVIMIAIMSFAMMHYRDKVNGGFMSYGKGFGLGLLTAVVGGVISSVFTYILFAFIDPALVDQLVQQAMEEAIAKNPAVEAQIDMVEKYTRMFMTPMAMMIMGIIASVIGGVIISLILAAIFKKEKPLFEAQAQE